MNTCTIDIKFNRAISNTQINKITVKGIVMKDKRSDLSEVIIVPTAIITDHYKKDCVRFVLKDITTHTVKNIESLLFGPMLFSNILLELDDWSVTVSKVLSVKFNFENTIEIGHCNLSGNRTYTVDNYTIKMLNQKLIDIRPKSADNIMPNSINSVQNIANVRF